MSKHDNPHKPQTDPSDLPKTEEAHQTGEFQTKHELREILNREFERWNQQAQNRSTHFNATYHDAENPSIPPTFERPNLPNEFAREQMAVLKTIFGEKNLAFAFLPTPNSIYDPKTKQPNPSYKKQYFPTEPDEMDLKAGLNARRSVKFDIQADPSEVGILSGKDENGDPTYTAEPETWSQALLRSQSEYIKSIKSDLDIPETDPPPTFLIETILKGADHYGTIEQSDTLLPVIQRACEAYKIENFKNSRLGMSVYEWMNISDYIEEEINIKLDKIPENNIQVQIRLCPKILANLHIMLIDPANSQPDIGEWGDEPLLRQDGTEDYYQLGGGRSINGGGSHLGRGPRTEHRDTRGARLAIVILKKDK